MQAFWSIELFNLWSLSPHKKKKEKKKEELFTNWIMSNVRRRSRISSRTDRDIFSFAQKVGLWNLFVLLTHALWFSYLPSFRSLPPSLPSHFPRYHWRVQTRITTAALPRRGTQTARTITFLGNGRLSATVDSLVPRSFVIFHLLLQLLTSVERGLFGETLEGPGRLIALAVPRSLSGGLRKQIAVQPIFQRRTAGTSVRRIRSRETGLEMILYFNV